MKNKNYLNNDMIIKELIISKGKGKITPELLNTFYLIAEGITVRLKVNYTNRKDYIQSAVLMMIEKYDKFDETKYQNAFSYFTEIGKRDMVNSFYIFNYQRPNSNNKTTYGLNILKMGNYPFNI